MKASYMVLFAMVLVLLTGGLWTLFGAGDELSPAEKVTREARQKIAAEEIQLVEAVVSARQSYKENLLKLIGFYARQGSNFKLKKAKRELDQLRAMDQYKYVVIAQAVGAHVRPLKDIPEAEKVFLDGRQYDTTPDIFNIDRNKRLALKRYLEVITRYPESIRVDDAAYYAGVIFEENLKDYYRATVYYEKCFEWEPKTPNPARIRAAKLYYKKIKDFREARRLYDLAAAEAPNPKHRKEAAQMVEKLKTLGF